MILRKYHLEKQLSATIGLPWHLPSSSAVHMSHNVCSKAKSQTPQYYNSYTFSETEFLLGLPEDNRGKGGELVSWSAARAVLLILLLLTSHLRGGGVRAGD